MQIVNLIQGSPEWHEHRRTHFNASDAAAMLGISPYMSREELLKRMATGIASEPTPEQQRIFARGHAIEAACRPHAETVIGESISPVVGVSGKLSASFDGITFGEDVIWECKTLNSTLREVFRTGAELPEHYRAQLEHQLLVSGAGRALFSAATITDGELDEVDGCWYESDPAMRQRIIDGWAQFEKDLVVWQPSEAEPAPVIGNAPESLPALRVEVSGQVIASNLAEFKAIVIERFKSIKTDLVTDQDFADAEETIKWCKGVEDKLEQAKENALSQTASIEEVFRTADDLKEVARQTRLTLDKAVKSQKEAKKTELVLQAKHDYETHIAKLQLDLDGLRLNVPLPNFGEAIKGLKTIGSMRAKIGAALLEAQSTANQAAGRIANNLKMLASVHHYSFLFSDRQALCEKDAETLELIIEQRVAQHKREQEAKLEAERARIRAEEEAKAKAAAQAQIEAERQRANAEEEAKQKAIRENPLGLIITEEVRRSHDAANAPTLQPVAAVANEALSTQATLNVTAINARLSPISLTAGGIAELGIEDTREGKSILYSEADYQKICTALVSHIQQARTAKQASA